MIRQTENMVAEPVAEEAPTTPANPYMAILDLAAQSTTRHGFLAKAVASIGRYCESPYSALHVSCGSETIQETNHRNGNNPRFWAPPVQEYLTDALAGGKPRAKLLSSMGASAKVAILAAPLVNESIGVQGAVATVIFGDENTARRKLAFLTAMAEVTAAGAGMIDAAHTRRADSSTVASNRALTRAAGAATPEELAFALTNSLRNKLGCEQVVMGLATGRRVRILSISGLDDINRRSPGVGRIRAAMEECLDLDKPIVCQNERDWEGESLASNHRLHQQWQSSARGACIASIPLHSGEDCTAILSLRRRADEPFRQELIADITATVEPFAPAMLLVKRAHRGLFRHVLDSGGGFVRALTTSGRKGLKVLTALACLAALWFCFGSLDYEVVVPAKVTPKLQRQVAVPYDGRLIETCVEISDVVRAGEVLCRFDQRDLLLQRKQLRAQYAVHEREYMRALATEEPVEARLVDAQKRLIQTQLDIVERRLEQTLPRAPFDGVIISGDLRKQVGGVLAQGAPLFDIAPLDQWSLEMDIPQNVSGELGAGLKGRFASHARPEDAQQFELTRLRPSAEIRNGENVYVAEATVDLNAEWMRPGMEGVAKVQVGRRKVWWVASHKVLDYLRLHFWL